jgi:glycosyltransferase involved in cell wall biosynthesis
MRILQLISSAGNYGAENMMVNLARALNRLGCQVAVGVFDNDHAPNTEVAAQAAALGLPVELIPCRGRADRGAVRAIRDCVQRQGSDLVHTHGYKADLYGYAATQRSGPALLATCHNWPATNLPLWVYSALDRLVLKRFARVVAVSEDVKKALRRFGVPAGKISVIGNGIDLNGFETALPLQRENGRHGLRVGMVGRLVWAKGPEHLLRAAREILKQVPATSFVFAGDGPARKDLEKLARDWGIDASVSFLGRRSDMPSVYASLDIVALPSLDEGMPMTLLEAMAARKSVVATRVGAVPQVVLSEQTGLLIEPGDTAQLQGAILRLLQDPALRAKLEENGHALVRERFSAEAMARNYLSLYENLLERRAA